MVLYNCKQQNLRSFLVQLSQEQIIELVRQIRKIISQLGVCLEVNLPQTKGGPWVSQPGILNVWIGCIFRRRSLEYQTLGWIFKTNHWVVKFSDLSGHRPTPSRHPRLLIYGWPVLKTWNSTIQRETYYHGLSRPQHAPGNFKAQGSGSISSDSSFRNLLYLYPAASYPAALLHARLWANSGATASFGKGEAGDEQNGGWLRAAAEVHTQRCTCRGFCTNILHTHGFDSIRILFSRGEIPQHAGNSPGFNPKDLSLWDVSLKNGRTWWNHLAQKEPRKNTPSEMPKGHNRL